MTLNNHSTPKDDLTWLFSTCESEMGIKSNFNAVLLASKYGTKRTRVDKDTGELTNGVAEDAYNEDALIDSIDIRRGLSRLSATSKNRRVMQAYARLHVSHQRTLEHAYEARQLPPEVLQAFGEASGVVPLTLTARSLTSFSWDWLVKAILRKDRHVAVLKREAERMFRDALEAYSRAKSVTPEEAEKPKGKRKVEEATP
jgi:hypothetical protein